MVESNMTLDIFAFVTYKRALGTFECLFVNEEVLGEVVLPHETFPTDLALKVSGPVRGFVLSESAVLRKALVTNGARVW